MGFPSMNAQTVSRLVTQGGVLTTTGYHSALTGPLNLFSVPAVVDVSGMEFSIGVLADSISGNAGLAAQTGSTLAVGIRDGGPSGDNTAVASLFTDITNTVGWVDTVPRDVTGTSATDLDADDWVNFGITTNPTTIAQISMADVVVAYIYGKPGAIN